MKYRALWAAAVAGLAIHFAGLGWDVYRHSADSTLAQREDVLSLANPSHLMIVVGMAIVAAALLGMAAIWMNDRAIGGSGFAGVVLRGVSLPVISIAAAGSIWLASTAEDSGHSHGETAHAHAPGTPEDHAHDISGPGTQDSSAFLLVRAGNPSATGDGHTHAPGAAAAADDPMGEGNKHTHGVEVNVTGDQLIAAGRFAQDVKEKTARYTDVRDALAAGYLQITQDLPGIAAHFVRLDYLADGQEMNPDRPEVLLYTKRLDGNWKLVGAMFMEEGPRDDTPPSYFGSLDVWHRHDNLCFLAGARVKTVSSASECVGGSFQPRGAYQMHVWVVDGGSGIFAHDYAPIAPGAFPPATLPAAQELRVQAR